jgi:glycosyltransferase involved in cell wall biosynthesis
MKILQISNRVPWPLNEGGNIGIYNYTRAYSELGHEVTLYCLDGAKHNTPLEEAYKELSKYATVDIVPIDTDVKMLPALSHLLLNKSYNVTRFYNKEFEDKLSALLKENKFDVVQLEGTFVGPYIELVNQLHKGLLALRMHNVEFEIWERLAKNETNPIKKIYLNKLSKQLKSYETQLLQKVDIVVPVTDDDGEKFKEIDPTAQCLTIPAGIDLDSWKYSPSQDIHDWYHIGSMEWHANSEAVNWYIKEIHPKLVLLDSKYKLHLAGKGIDKTTFARYDRLMVKDNVPSAYDFVKSLDVCVVPLKSGSGIRLKILEAMAAGKLVVSTTVGAQGIDYIASKHLLIADTPSQYTEVYRQLQKGEIDWKAIIKNARNLVEEHYSTSALAKKQLDHYTSLLQ